jgi:hypothetical protein
LKAAGLFDRDVDGFSFLVDFINFLVFDGARLSDLHEFGVVARISLLEFFDTFLGGGFFLYFALDNFNNI